jgi:hypothetical protein
MSSFRKCLLTYKDEVHPTLLFKAECAGQGRPDLIDYSRSERRGKTSADLGRSIVFEVTQ